MVGPPVFSGLMPVARRTALTTLKGEQGDPLMPALFALGLRPADRERVLAFLDDLYVRSPGAPPVCSHPHPVQCW